ncbi:MAG: hypothetical protein L0220_32680, partial [Acidobacteria bacterium]|nr:hypothetical protein [Acidobacteriota bacterium]
EPDSTDEPVVRGMISEQHMCFDYFEDVGFRDSLSVRIGTMNRVWQAVRLNPLEHGLTIETHECPDKEGEITYKAIGVLPTSQSEINRLVAFLKYARRTEETRGRKARIILEEILDALMHLPDKARWSDIAEYVTRSLQSKYRDDFDAL